MNIKNRKESAVFKFVSIFSGRSASFLGPAASVTSSGSDIAVVVKLHSGQNNVILTYLKSQGRTKLQAEETLKSTWKWYEIVDGRYCHEAILKLVNSNLKWIGFRLTVTCVQAGLPLESYQQFARTQNMSHSPEFYVKFIFSDVICNLRMEHNQLKLKDGKVTSAMVFSAHCEEMQYWASALRKTAQTAMRLSPLVKTSWRHC